MSKQKTRPGYSELVEAFFFEIGYCPKEFRGVEYEDPQEPGRKIVHDPEPPECSPVVERIAEALDAIINDCAKPDEVLEIERFRGGQEAAHKRPLAWQIHRWKKQGYTGAAIEAAAKVWLAQNGYDFELSESRLENIYKETGFKELGPNFGSPRDWAKNRRR